MTEQEWKEQRRTCIGASEAATILGESDKDWMSRFSIWAEKVHGIETVEESERMRIGSRIEEFIAGEFVFWAEENIPDYGGIYGDGKTLYHSEAYPCIGATPDRLVCDNDGNNIGVCEIKNLDKFTHVGGENIATEKLWETAIPLQYQIQVQQQLYVLGLRRGWIAALIGGNKFKVYQVEANERFMSAMVAAEVDFWERYVETKTPPPTDGTEATTTAIKLLHPNDDGSELELGDPEWIGKIIGLEEIKKQIKELECRRTVIENELKAVIGSSTFAYCGDKKISFRTQTRPAHEVKESTFRVLRIGKRKTK